MSELSVCSFSFKGGLEGTGGGEISAPRNVRCRRQLLDGLSWVLFLGEQWLVMFVANQCSPEVPKFWPACSAFCGPRAFGVYLPDPHNKREAPLGGAILHSASPSSDETGPGDLETCPGVSGAGPLNRAWAHIGLRCNTTYIYVIARGGEWGRGEWQPPAAKQRKTKEPPRAVLCQRPIVFSCGPVWSAGSVPGNPGNDPEVPGAGVPGTGPGSPGPVPK